MSLSLQGAIFYGKTDGLEQRGKQQPLPIEEEKKAQILKILKRYTLAQ